MKKIRNNLIALINRQVIKPITNANFGQGEWAEIKFRELTKQSEYNALKLFIDFIARGGAKLTGEQQVWAADIIGAPTGELEEMLEAGELDVKPAPVIVVDPETGLPAQPSPGQMPGQMPEEKEVEKEKKPEEIKKNEVVKPDIIADKSKSEKEEKNTYQYTAGKYSRALTPIEKKMNFSEVDKKLDDLNDTHAATIGKTIKTILGDLKDAIIRRRIVERKNYDAVNQLTLKGMPALRAAFSDMLKTAFEAGKESAMPSEQKMAMFPTQPKAYEEVAEWLKNRTVYLANEEAETLLKIAKGTLMDGIRTGANLKDVIAMLEDEFTAWDMDDAVGGGRIETIVRTNTLAAFNESRGQQFAKMGDAIIGYQYSAIMDNRVSEICSALDKTFITPAEYDQFCPPNHFNCRSTLVPIFHDEMEETKDLSEPPAVKREKGGFLTLK